MIHRRLHPAVLLVAILWCGCFNTLAAQAQSEAELRRSNEQLRTQVRDLERELEAARARIQELEREVEVLRNALGNTQSPGSSAPDAEPPPIDTSNPTSSPPALLHTLKASYAEAINGLEPGVDRSRERSVYLRTVARWAASSNRQYREPIEWHVKVNEAVANRPGYLMTLVVVDPKSSREVGEPFDVQIPRMMARRYDQLRERGEDVSTLILRGVLIPDIRVNENRLERGAFDNPPFIGPFAEFTFSVEPRSLLPVGEEP